MSLRLADYIHDAGHVEDGYYIDKHAKAEDGHMHVFIYCLQFNVYRRVPTEADCLIW